MNILNKQPVFYGKILIQDFFFIKINIGALLYKIVVVIFFET